ncbi:hypothetical protein BDN67DRAFT_427346 [Paxillus ammoniavirescens]|nr:hypothetical protein BDN67DRAFT_427346 [Paxillus ammoniavirescens]
MLTRSGVVVPPALLPRKRIIWWRGYDGADDLSLQFLTSQASLYSVARHLLNFALRTCSLLRILPLTVEQFVDEEGTRQGVRGFFRRRYCTRARMMRKDEVRERRVEGVKKWQRGSGPAVSHESMKGSGAQNISMVITLWPPG